MKKKQRLLLWLLTVILILPAPLTARADSGPKPSVVITAEGLEGRTCYGTLLSEDPYNGPPDLAAIQAPDRETPEDEDGFMTSEIGERYAFDSYYTMDLSGSGSGVSIPLTESYNYTKEIVSLIARILIMILLELLLALLFGFREKHQLLLITAINVLTQVILNVAVNILWYTRGTFFFIFILGELIVMFIELVLYFAFLPGVSRKPADPVRIFAYAILANLLSLAAGIGIAAFVPAIF
ncbi:MAG TPA: ABC transporter permease [Firmicutes bacterium]|nr:ABC transporter permease [Bacillota bacterium]